MEDNRISHAGATAQTLLRRKPHQLRRILVVDKISDLRLMYGFVLSRPGYHVDLAEDGAAAWEALRASRYNLLITENDLPKLTGMELVRKLRAAHMALPVVMAAGRLPTEELARNPSLRLAATLLKPFAVDELLDTVRQVLRPTGSAPEQMEFLPIQLMQPPTPGLAVE